MPLLIKDTLAKLYTIKIYSKFNIIAVFNKIRVKKGYKKKTAFLTRYKLFKYIIILFRLYNASAIFQVFINKIFYKYLNIFYIAYLNNIFIYSNSIDKYIGYI